LFRRPLHAVIFAHQRSNALMQVKVLTDSQSRKKAKNIDLNQSHFR
jgi:hypothetical protein